MTSTGWRLRIEHTTRYSYSAPVRASFNEARVIPQTTPGQTALDIRVTTSPTVPLFRYVDYWGTQVVAFDVPGAHDHLEVRSTALVETNEHRVLSAPASWAEVKEAGERSCELVSPSVHTRADEELAETALSLRRSTPIESIEAVTDWVHNALSYAVGVTGVHTSAVEAWNRRSGVCQDYTHLAITLFRVLGMPARYVSGYLHPNPEAPVDHETVGESHAWVEAWAGEWWPYDPTNAVEVGPRHVTVARGRDYSDVPPLKGIFAGAAQDRMDVEVRVLRLQ